MVKQGNIEGNWGYRMERLGYKMERLGYTQGKMENNLEHSLVRLENKKEKWDCMRGRLDYRMGK